MSEFTPDEQRALAPYFSNLDGPVFALTNLPETVKGALFARYSRSAKSLRRLFLDEFLGNLQGGAVADSHVGVERAEKLYAKVFADYGDDSVAQLGGVHLACEGVSNIAHQGDRVGPPDGLPRAVHALRAVHRSARRPLEVLRAGGARGHAAAGPLSG